MRTRPMSPEAAEGAGSIFCTVPLTMMPASRASGRRSAVFWADAGNTSRSARSSGRKYASLYDINHPGAGHFWGKAYWGRPIETEPILASPWPRVCEARHFPL